MIIILISPGTLLAEGKSMGNKLSEGEPIKCRICGKTFVPRGTTTVTCSDECSKENARRKKLEWEKRTSISARAKVKRLSIGEINQLARDAGMTYGKYVSELNKGGLK